MAFSSDRAVVAGKFIAGVDEMGMGNRQPGIFAGIFCVPFSAWLGNILGNSMFSLQKLLGKEDKFFNLLEASAEEARASVQALVKLNKNPDQPTLLYEFIQSRRKDKQITAQISEAVYTTFVTALEREDIQELSN